MAALLALISSIAWGVADYMGGVASRRAGAMQILVVAYPAGAVIITLFAVFAVPGEISNQAIVWGIVAGLIGAIAVALLYIALSRGPMGIVSPITAVMSGSVPLAVGVIRGERLTSLAIAGVILAVIAVVLVTREKTEHRKVQFSTVLIAIASGTAIGLYLSALGSAPVDSGIWAATVGRWTSSVFVAIAVFVVLRSFTRSNFPWQLAIISGFLDAGANAIFQLASQRGLLAIVAVLGSLYPATTVLLARVLLHERLIRIQLIGVYLAFAAAAALALA
ncbi:MAG: EamA family transporter [Candidatus Nanopelagicales bacterium]